MQNDQAFGWSKAQAAVPFEVAIGTIVVGSHIGGRIQDRRGPRALPTKAFLPLGIGYLVAVVIGASLFGNPPTGYLPPGMSAPVRAADDTATAPTKDPVPAEDFTAPEALRTPQWYLLTAILTLSVTAGISLILVAAGSASDVGGYSTAAAPSLVGGLDLFNGGGRISSLTSRRRPSSPSSLPSSARATAARSTRCHRRRDGSSASAMLE